MSVFNRDIHLAGVLRRLGSLACSYNPFLEFIAVPHSECSIVDGGLQCRPPQRLKAFEVPIGQAISNPSEIRKLIAARRVVLALPTSLAFEHQFEIPQGSEFRTAEMLDLELMRVTPFQEVNVHRGWYLAHQLHSQNRIVRCFIVRRDVIDNAVEIVKAAGGTLSSVIVRDEGGKLLPFVVTMDGLPYHGPEIRVWRKTGIAGAMMSLLALSILGFSASDLQSRRQEALALISSQSEAQAKRVRQTIDKMKKAKAEATSLNVAQAQSVRRLSVIEELSKILPDNAYLQSLSIEGNTGIAEGAAVAPENLIALMDASPILKNASFVSPLTKNPGDDKSRFSIKFELSALND